MNNNADSLPGCVTKNASGIMMVWYYLTAVPSYQTMAALSIVFWSVKEMCTYQIITDSCCDFPVEMYRKLMPAARKYGVKICLENMFATQNGHKVARACRKQKLVSVNAGLINSFLFNLKSLNAF